MQLAAKSDPLDNFPVLRSRDVEEVRHVIASLYTRPDLTPTNDRESFDTVINNCCLRTIELSYARYGAAVDFRFPGSDCVVLLLPVRGRGEINFGSLSVQVKPSTATVIPAAAEGHRSRYSGDHACLILRVRLPALAEKLAAITGAAIDQPLQIYRVQEPGRPAALMLQRYLPLLVDTVSAARESFPDWWMAQTEQLVMTLLLCGYRHNYSRLLDRDVPDAAPLQVRLAEEHIEVNCRRAITLEELAEVSGVSAFSLFRAFRKFRGYTPLEFAAQMRQASGD